MCVCYACLGILFNVRVRSWSTPRNVTLGVSLFKKQLYNRLGRRSSFTFTKRKTTSFIEIAEFSKVQAPPKQPWSWRHIFLVVSALNQSQWWHYCKEGCFLHQDISSSKLQTAMCLQMQWCVVCLDHSTKSLVFSLSLPSQAFALGALRSFWIEVEYLGQQSFLIFS